MSQKSATSFFTGLIVGTFLGIIGRLLFVHNMLKQDKLKDLSLFGRSKRIKF